MLKNTSSPGSKSEKITGRWTNEAKKDGFLNLCTDRTLTIRTPTNRIEL